MDVRSITVDGRPATFAWTAASSMITPAQEIADGEVFTAKVTYSGVAKPVRVGTDLFAVGWQTDGGEAFVVSEPAGAATSSPSSDHPTDKATYTIQVTAPSDQTVAANGLLVAQDDIGHGATSWTYEARDQMASYLVQVAIGDYELIDGGSPRGVPSAYAFHRSVATSAREATKKTADMIDVLADVVRARTRSRCTGWRRQSRPGAVRWCGRVQPLPGSGGSATGAGPPGGGRAVGGGAPVRAVGGGWFPDDGPGFGVGEFADRLGDRGAVPVGAFHPEPGGIDLRGGDLDGLAHERDLLVGDAVVQLEVVVGFVSA